MVETPKTLVVDVDGTLCPLKKPDERYEDLLPYPDMLDGLRRWRGEGGRIILHTSRNMRSYRGNIGLINANTAPVLIAWLKQWDVPFDEIIFGKPWAGENGFYIDDRAIRPREFLTLPQSELDRLVREGRPAHKSA